MREGQRLIFGKTIPFAKSTYCEIKLFTREKQEVELAKARTNRHFQIAVLDVVEGSVKVVMKVIVVESEVVSGGIEKNFFPVWNVIGNLSG